MSAVGVEVITYVNSHKHQDECWFELGFSELGEDLTGSPSAASTQTCHCAQVFAFIMKMARARRCFALRGFLKRAQSTYTTVWV